MKLKTASLLWAFSVVLMLCFGGAAKEGGTKEANPEDVDAAKKEIDKRLKEMSNAGMIKDEKINDKLGDIQDKLDKLKGKPVTGEKEVNAISNAIKGLPEIVAGIQTRNYVAVILGGLKVTAAICVLIPPIAPFAPLGMTILSSLTTIMSLFSSNKKQVAEDPLKSALREFRVEGLKDEIASVQYSWEVMISSVSRFEDFINDGDVITSDLAMELYSNSFRSVGIFGKLKLFITENCITADHTQAENGAKFVKTCLDLATKYAQLTATRGMILTRMAGIVSVAEKHYKDTNKEVKMKEMVQIRQNFIHLADKQRDIDKGVLSFFTDPLNSFRSKRVIFEMFHKPYEYNELLSYLHSLDDQFTGMIDNDHVILCPEEKLGGLCRQMGVTDDFKPWDNTNVPTKSWFVPKGLRLSAEDTSSKKYGPFIGMNVYSPTTLAELSKFKVDEDPDSADARDYVILCNSEGWCDSIKTLEDGVGAKIDNYNGINFNALKTVFVPPSFKVEIFQMEQTTTKKKAGPFYGPIKQHNINNCHNLWNSINISPLEPGEDGTKMVKLCSPADEFCTQIEPGAEMETEETGFWDFLKSSPVQCKPSLEYGKLDMYIPQGRRVIISKGESKLGPFTGPTFYPKMAVEKLSIKVDDLWVDRKAKKQEIESSDDDYQASSYKSESPEKRHRYPKRYQSHHQHHHHRFNQTMAEAVL